MSTLPVLNQPPRRSGALLDQLTRRMRRRAESVLAPLGLRTRHLVALTVLRENGGGATQQALAATLLIDRANVVGLLNELETEGLVERKRSELDRRRHIVELTYAGTRRLAAAEFALAAAEDEVLAALDGEQRAALYDLLHQAVGGCAPLDGRAPEHEPGTCAAAAAEGFSADDDCESDSDC
ncbi:MarR family winged helix-turn-helix transcriptional regulator [Actinacidiphila guanduensis]|uniref:DNA-binding transcriptional regulator, MarR family n=1 Tax=Actinacidiphila guanduensis TaxID=310781 RepID=A0A1G9Y0T7_9ACTN|nr:MarR family winged helix-turn-helix transcriptional regulator [Actinacidiphila guanduensis]SDN02241.1 DNA-binding transcriptional regulator, MarR family [Actinacidiphila guanduensis]